jgi:hypothetical protein
MKVTFEYQNDLATIIECVEFRCVNESETVEDYKKSILDYLNNMVECFVKKEFNSLLDYLDMKGFNYSDYSGTIYWHHDKCNDILKLDNKSQRIYYYSCPLEIFNKELGLPRDEKGNEFICNKNHVDILVEALNSIKDE